MKQNLDDLIDFKTGRQKRLIYSDPDIYQQELKIFLPVVGYFLPTIAN